MKKKYLKFRQPAQNLIVLILFVCLFWAAAQAQTPTDGKYKALNPNGTLKETGYYVKGQKHKRWVYYNEQGIMERKEKWENGVLVWQIFYNPKGKITRTIDRNGKEKVKPACGC